METGHQLSIDSYYETRKKRSNSNSYSRTKFAVLECLNRYYFTHGATCEQIEQKTCLSHQTASARLADCRKKGFVEWKRDASGKIQRRPTESGSTAGVNQITRAGVKEYVRLASRKINKENQN